MYWRSSARLVDSYDSSAFRPIATSIAKYPMRFLGLVLLMLSGVGHMAQAQSRVVTVCYDETAVRPWVNAAGVSLLKATASLQHVEFEQVALPWLRCLRNVSNGTMAGAIGASYSDERAAFAVFPATADGQLDPSRRMNVSSYSLYRAKGTKTQWDGKQFTNLASRVVVQRGHSVVADLTKMGVLVDQSAGDAETVLRMVMAGRSQLGALVTELGDEMLTKPEFRRQVEKITPPLVVKSYYLIFGKRYYENNTRLVEELWNHLAVVRDAKDPDSLLRLRMGR